MAQGTRTSTPGGALRRHRPRHGKVVSQAPGRLRVRLHRAHRDPAELALIDRALAPRVGVESVATNARTGSVLVHYDHQTLSRDDVVAMLRDVGVIAGEVLGAEELPEDPVAEIAEQSTTATGLIGALGDLDQRVSRLTGGRVDVKLLVPAAIGVLGLRQVMTGGFGLAEVPGYLLLWYTFDTFHKLHQRQTVHAAPAAGSVSPSTSSDADHADPAPITSTPAHPTGGRRRSRRAGETGPGRT